MHVHLGNKEWEDSSLFKIKTWWSLKLKATLQNFMLTLK